MLKTGIWNMKGSTKLFGIVLLTFLLSIRANGTETNSHVNALDNASSEYAVCASYFSILSGSLKEQEKSLSDEYLRVSEKSMLSAVMLAKTNRTQKMATKVTLARYNSYLKNMMNEIDLSYSNISILLNQHSERCKFAIDSPKEFLADLTG